MSPDSPINRTTITEMPIEDVFQMVEAIRARRLHLAHRAQLLRDMKSAKRLDEVMTRYAKLYETTVKQLSKIDDAIELADKRMSQLRAMALEMDDIHDPTTEAA